ncbi:hypothetical protein CI105_08455 [Candidatus Izimaplasma bacterium ZiA1]|uniref:hypothetical protein n=1 Tax=Candidatus Izimoplasma sp. ZiA1 TaxID=2024899 RepID=UPI000BAA376A|nr:hypothetical protein CI105_08455 [Candidatus Izimaplasma bacterium ZiA1]
MKAVLNRIKDKGFTEVTIGIDNSSFDKLNSIYTDLGFTTIIKETNIDNHYLDEFKNPVKYDDMYLIKMMRL